MPVAQSRLEILQICRLLQCVSEKDLAQIQKLVLNGIPHIINYNEPNEGEIPLSVATKENDEELVKFLLELGAHPDVKDFEGRTALMMAASYGHVQCFQTLIEAGTDLDAVDLKGQGIFFYCLQPTERHAECFALALASKADVNARAKDGRTAFFAACENAKDNEPMCLALLDNGADPNIIQESSGRSALMACAASGGVKVMQAALRKGADPNVIDRFGKTAAHEAAKNGHLPALMCLAGYGVSFDVYDTKGNNPIHNAAMGGHAMCCKFLGQRGCNPKAKNGEGELARVIAKEKVSGKASKECIRELRKAERSFGKVDLWSLKLYDWSVEKAPELLEVLKKFDPDDSGIVLKEDFLDTMKNLDSPIMENEDEMIRKILPLFEKNRDGKIDYKDFLTGKKYINKLYLHSAFDPKKKKKRKGGKGGRKKKGKPPMEICTMPSNEIMRTLDGGPPIMFIPKQLNASDPNRFSPDHPPDNPLIDDSSWYMPQPGKQYISITDAARHSDMESIKRAVEMGYHIDTRDKYYKTPLMVACQQGNLEMAKTLIANGANVNAKDNFHWTPLHHAAHTGMIDVVELLVNNGAQIDAVAMNGATPLFRAIESSRLNVVEYLVSKGAKLSTENRKGNNAMDISYFFADPRVHDVVKTKVEALPPSKDKRGAKSGGGAGGKKEKV